MSDRLSGAIEELELQLQEQELEVANTKKLINSLLKRLGEQPRYNDVATEGIGSMRADEYYGKTVTTAVQMYLERRHTALSVEDITRGLAQGGFDFKGMKWSENAYVRNVAISLSKNPTMFHKLPNGTWGLTPWYPNAAVAKKDKSDKDAPADEKKPAASAGKDSAEKAETPNA
jgi:hypothetical protein